MSAAGATSSSPFGRIVLDGERHRSWCALWAAWHNPLADVGMSPRCTCGELTVEDIVAWWALQARQSVTS